MSLAAFIKEVLLGASSVSDGIALQTLKGVPGRGENSYSSALRDWLESNREVFPERIGAEVVDHMRDSGADVILEGLDTGTRIGFQIKSDNDLRRADFTRELKAQITDARAWGLSLYVIILACSPTPKNSQKYLNIVNEVGRSPDESIIVITPNRAAGLWGMFGTPMPPARRTPRGWTDFFIAAGHPSLIPRYIDDWHGLPPDERFQPPAEFAGIVEASATNPLTVITGPPAAGKTFAAMQMLWRDYRAGRDVEWITPARYLLTEGVVPDREAPPDMRQRIELLTLHLSLEQLRRPLDATEFVAAHLKPNSTVYIEDPFGKTDDEFEFSLHTYSFFDLNRFVAEIGEGAARHGCRILVTSREALFERWLAELECESVPRPALSLHQIGKNSYTSQQRVEIARRLVATRDVQDVEGAARLIAAYTHVPLDAELIVRDLPSGAAPEQVAAAADKSAAANVDRLRDRVASEQGHEHLFLLLLIALDEPDRVKHNNFREAFTTLHGMIGADGDAEQNLGSALRRFRAIVSRREVTVMQGSATGRGFKIARRNDEGAYNLEPVHSSVSDAAARHLRGSAVEWLTSVAASLRTAAVGTTSRRAQTKIAMLFVRWGIGGAKSAAQEGMLNAVYADSSMNLLHTFELMKQWSSLPSEFRERFFDVLEDESDFLHTSEACSLLNVLPMPEADAWRLLRLLLRKRAMGVGFILSYGGHPWRYLVHRLANCPADLREPLDELALEQPSLFTYAMSRVLVGRWEDTPEDWRQALLNPEVLSDRHARQNLFIAIAEGWAVAPEELRRMLVEQARVGSSGARAAACIAALVLHESSPQDFHPLYMNAARDADISVPLRVMTEGMGDDEHDREFAEALYERADEAAATQMLIHLTQRGKPEIEWKLDLARRCAIKGGDVARGALAYYCLNKPLTDEFMGYRLSTSPAGESEMIRLAWIWAYINSGGTRPALTADEAIEVVESLTPEFRRLVLFYLSVQAHHLPSGLPEYLARFQDGSAADAEAIEEGAGERQPPTGSRLMYGYPASQLAR